MLRGSLVRASFEFEQDVPHHGIGNLAVSLPDLR